MILRTKNEGSQLLGENSKVMDARSGWEQRTAGQVLRSGAQQPPGVRNRRQPSPHYSTLEGRDNTYTVLLNQPACICHCCSRLRAAPVLATSVSLTGLTEIKPQLTQQINLVMRKGLRLTQQNKMENTKVSWKLLVLLVFVIFSL